MQQIADPDVERQQGKIGNRALKLLDMQKLIYFSNSCKAVWFCFNQPERKPNTIYNIKVTVHPSWLKACTSLPVLRNLLTEVGALSAAVPTVSFTGH